ncbi:MAG TPA: SH3 domain-containing protein [Polyangiaceae bacterium]
MRRPETPLAIEMPPTGADRPAWTKVGIVAAVGFGFGILWPRLTSTRIAPNPPNDNAAPAAATSGQGGPLALAASAPAVTVQPPAANPPPADQAISVSPGIIVRCRDGNSSAKEECGPLEFDRLAIPKIKALAQCAAASGASGKLSIGFDVDFQRNAAKVLLGKSTTLPRDKAEALIRCTDPSFDKSNLGELPHQHRRYTIFYTASFAPTTRPKEPSNEKPAADGPPAAKTTSETAASATVNWDVAIVRDAPKTGSIVGRLLRGAKVKVLAHQGEWYRIQYGSIEGWVYRGTVGL